MVQDLTISEFAQITRKHIETVRRLARMGKSPGAYKLGGRWLISREAADRIRRLQYFHAQNLDEYDAHR